MSVDNTPSRVVRLTNPLRRRPYRRKLMRGFTLVEMMVAIAVAGILVAIAVPSFSGIAERNRLRNAAEKLRSDVKLARSESLRRNRTVVMSFATSSGGATWCYGMRVDTSCDCTPSATPATACELDTGVSTVVSQATYRGVTLPTLPYASALPVAGTLHFNPARPALDNGSASFFSPSGKEATVMIANQGRVRLCSPTNANNLFYFDPC